jgi:hypothetical protein
MTKETDHGQQDVPIPQPHDVHKHLRLEWGETPPDLAYRFVVSFDALQAANVAERASPKRKMRRWERAPRYVFAFILKYALYWGVALGIPYLVAILVDRLFNATERLGGNAIVGVMTFLATFAAISISGRILIRRTKAQATAYYREFFGGNEFLLEVRKSHLWFAERSAGAIRRWSTFEAVVEFEQGMWLFLRRATTFASRRGLLITRESLPGSCDWKDLSAYVRERIQEAAMQIETSEQR